MKIGKDMLKKLIQEALEIHLAPDNLNELDPEEAYGLGYQAKTAYDMSNPAESLHQIIQEEYEKLLQDKKETALSVNPKLELAKSNLVRADNKITQTAGAVKNFPIKFVIQGIGTSDLLKNIPETDVGPVTGLSTGFRFEENITRFQFDQIIRQELEQLLQEHAKEYVWGVKAPYHRTANQYELSVLNHDVLEEKGKHHDMACG